MKTIIFLLLFISVAAITATAQQTATETDNYTIQRLIIFNKKNEILMDKARDGSWQTPALRSNKNESVNEGLNNLAAKMGITIEKIKLAGIYTYKYKDLANHPAAIAFRTHYTAKYKSGELIQPENLKGEYKWMTIKEALEKITFQALKLETTQIIKHPKTVWGGSFLHIYKDGKHDSMQILEEMYPLTN
jgi:hypothetical protein